MIRIFIPLGCFIIVMLGSSYADFGKNQKKELVKQGGQQQKKVVITKQDIEEGKILISKSDCSACHKSDMKIVGPSYMNISKKYIATDKNLELLAKKIINGGSGVWGDMYMAPHASVSVSEAKKMVKYILSHQVK